MRTQPISTVGRALRRRLWLIVLLTVAGGVAAHEATVKRPPVYEATALVSVDESGAASQGVDVAMQADQFLTQRFIALGTSRQVLQAVCAKERHGCDATALARQVRVTTPKATAQLAIVADASSPATAARLANEVADALIATNRAQVDEQLGPQRALLQDQLKQQGAQLSLALQQVAANDQVPVSDPAARPNTAGVAQLTFLQTQYSSTYQRLQDLDLQRSRQYNLLSVEQRAVPVATPVDPDPIRYLAIGLVAGLLAGLLVALAAGGMRNRIRSSSDLAEASGTDVVVDFTRDLMPGAGRPYAYLVRISLAEAAEHQQAVLLVGSTLGERVNAVGQELASAVAASGSRVLVLLAPTPSVGWWWWRKTDRPSKILVEPDAADGQLAPRQGEGVDLVIHCSLPPMLDPSVTWLRSTPDSAILVATQGLTRFGEVRRTVEMLHRTGVQIHAAILLPLRIKSVRLPAPLPQPVPKPVPASAVEAPAVEAPAAAAVPQPLPKPVPAPAVEARPAAAGELSSPPAGELPATATAALDR
ncbi:MAG TPA: Wzz/FepE/Etk N-terminal domain-containing protein [Candidatus Dormibacteraeota bacterium]|nr:Wzz/FepE/Etk N-terminal domain-containing protein [Candidatus Dormibacteraeota bacterium]